MIRIGIVGYGNLARGVECAIAHNEDMELVAVFTRRSPEAVSIQTPGIPVQTMDQLNDWQGKLDLLLLCGGSATDLPELTPRLAKNFNVIDSFDTHAKIPAHFAAVDQAARETEHIALISAGWDPGMFSVNRVYAEAILPQGKAYTFWGKGVSQGHSDAVRRIPGVVDARQYTIPVPAAMDRVRSGENPSLTTREKHTRECFVVAEDGADTEAIAQAIITMPDYFSDYDTTVHFISAEEMRRDHAGLPHGGSVIHTGVTGMDGESHHTIEYSLRLDSNPQFTASVLVCYARAAMRMFSRGERGCRTVFDVAPGDLSARSRQELLAQML